MAVKLLNRIREVTGSIYIERWLQIDAGTDVLYGNSTLSPSLSGDLNRIDTLSDSLTSGSTWYGGSDPGEYDAGESNKAWYGQVIRVPFKVVVPAARWESFHSAIQAFVESAFPDELILEANQRGNRPKPDDVNSPAKYVIWAIEY